MQQSGYNRTRRVRGPVASVRLNVVLDGCEITKGTSDICACLLKFDITVEI